MLSLLCIFLSPVLVVISLPLAIFAALTTSLAFSALFLRALVVYAELTAVLIQNQFATNHGPAAKRVSSDRKSTPPVMIDEKDTRRKSRRSSACSGNSNGGSMTPKRPESSGLGIYGSGGIERDFEGVGGWRIPGSDDDDVLWTSMNSRLELPAIVDERKRNHHRSLTSSSLSTASLIPGSRAPSFARTPSSTRAAGNASPEEYFANRTASKSTTALDTVNIGKSLLRRKTSSTSTFSSASSTRTLPASTSHS
ncbi:hypothetical protein MMC22_000948 [Lobaria immixta]|nr:hypothetical protein [Lobaria immixta]